MIDRQCHVWHNPWINFVTTGAFHGADQDRPPELPEIIGWQHVFVQPDRPVRRLTHLFAVRPRHQRLRRVGHDRRRLPVRDPAVLVPDLKHDQRPVHNTCTHETHAHTQPSQPAPPTTQGLLGIGVRWTIPRFCVSAMQVTAASQMTE